MCPGQVFTAFAGKMLGRWRVDSEILRADTGEEFVWVTLDEHLSGPWRPSESMRRVWPLRLIPNSPNK